jgi:sugar lactone lactonase YvrE
MVPQGVAVHPKSNEIYVVDNLASIIVKVSADGLMAPVAGTGKYGYEDGPANRAQFYWPTAIAFDSAGQLYVADLLNHRVRVLQLDGTVKTVVGTGRVRRDDNATGLGTSLFYPTDVKVDRDDSVFIVDSGNNRVLRYDPRTNTMRTIAGTGERGFAGDGGPARLAKLNTPRGIALSTEGILYIADSHNGRIRAMRLR